MKFPSKRWFRNVIHSIQQQNNERRSADVVYVIYDAYHSLRLMRSKTDVSN